MQVIDLPIDSIHPPDWNPNQLNQAGLSRLKCSIQRFGLVAPLVVRPMGEGRYQTIGGAQRLSVLHQLGFQSAPSVVVVADDANARLLAQALNRIQGEDDLGLKAELLRQVLAEVPPPEVLSLLPETSQSLQALSTLGQQDLASYLRDWQASQAARLKHLTFQSTEAQREVIDKALDRVLPEARSLDSGNPNLRGNALFLLCQQYLNLMGRS